MKKVKPKIVNGKNQLFASNFGTDTKLPVLSNSAEIAEIEVPELDHDPEIYNTGFDTASFESLQKFVGDCIGTLAGDLVTYKKRKMLAFYCFSLTSTETETGSIKNPFTSLEDAFSYIECLLQKTCYSFDVVLYVSGKHEMVKPQTYRFNRRLFVTPYPEGEEVSLIFGNLVYLHHISFLDCKNIKCVQTIPDSTNGKLYIDKLVNSGIDDKIQAADVAEAYYSSVSSVTLLNPTECHLSVAVGSFFSNIHVFRFHDDSRFACYSSSTFSDSYIVPEGLLAKKCAFQKCRIRGDVDNGKHIAWECTFENEKYIDVYHDYTSDICMRKCTFDYAYGCYIEESSFTHRENQYYCGIINCEVEVGYLENAMGISVDGSVKNSVFTYNNSNGYYHAFVAEGDYNDTVIENNTFQGSIQASRVYAGRGGSCIFRFGNVFLKNNKTDFLIKPDINDSSTDAYIVPIEDNGATPLFKGDFTVNISFDDIKAKSDHHIFISLYGTPVSSIAEVNYSYNISYPSGVKNYSVTVYEFSRGGTTYNHCYAQCGTVGKYTIKGEEDGYITNASGVWNGRTYTETATNGETDTCSLRC
jgi:hypothetical protein